MTDEWVIHTPDDGAIKWWIGNAAEDGRAATVFARLRIPQPQPDAAGNAWLDHGVHAFVVPLRDENGNTLPGVEIHDCGYKVGKRGDAGREGLLGGLLDCCWVACGAAACTGDKSVLTCRCCRRALVAVLRFISSAAPA